MKKRGRENKTNRLVHGKVNPLIHFLFGLYISEWGGITTSDSLNLLEISVVLIVSYESRVESEE